MVMETIVEVVVGRANDKEIRHFEVNIEQEINELNSLKKRNVQLALEAFANCRDQEMEDMEDMSFMVFYKGLRLPEGFDIPAVSDPELIHAAMAEGVEFQVKIIDVYQRIPAGSLFIPDHNSFSVKRVSFEQALLRVDGLDVILANTEMKALLTLEDFKYLRAGWD